MLANSLMTESDSCKADEVKFRICIDLPPQGGALNYIMDRGGVQSRVADPYPAQTKIVHPSQKAMVKL